MNRGFPFVGRAVNDKPPIAVDWAPEINCLGIKARAIRLDVHLREHLFEMYVHRTVNHDAHRTFIVVRANISDGLGKMRVLERRHRDEKVIG